jgi:hypothetical protein
MTRERGLHHRAAVEGTFDLDIARKEECPE